MSRRHSDRSSGADGGQTLDTPTPTAGRSAAAGSAGPAVRNRRWCRAEKDFNVIRLGSRFVPHTGTSSPGCGRPCESGQGLSVNRIPAASLTVAEPVRPAVCSGTPISRTRDPWSRGGLPDRSNWAAPQCTAMILRPVCGHIRGARRNVGELSAAVLDCSGQQQATDEASHGASVHTNHDTESG